MARKTKEEAMETRERILDAAIDVFYEYGVTNSSLEQVAEAAGVTRGAIYWHFKNKADIFSALHDQMHIPLMQDLIRIQENLSDNPLNDLMDFCISALLDLNADEKKQKIFSLFTLKCDYSGELAVFFEEHNKKQKEDMSIIVGFFKAAMKKGVISPQSDPDMLALALLCYVCGIFTEFLSTPSLFDLKKQARPLIEQLFKSF